MAEIEIQYGRDLCDLRDRHEPRSLREHTAIGWIGRSWAGSPVHETIRLFRIWFFDTHLKGEEQPFPSNAELCNVHYK